MLLANPAEAQQPLHDRITIEADGCFISVSFVDGADDSLSYSISTNAAVIANEEPLDDIVGDQSGVLAVFTVKEGDLIHATLQRDGLDDYDAKMTAKPCPTPTSTPTSTSTPTVVPTSTATLAPTSTATATPTAVPPTPIVVTNTIERVVTVEVPAVTSGIKPPNTGGAGLAAPADWDYYVGDGDNGPYYDGSWGLCFAWWCF
jgi:hypothetical protein